MKSDIEIAQSATLLPMEEIARKGWASCLSEYAALWPWNGQGGIYRKLVRQAGHE